MRYLMLDRSEGDDGVCTLEAVASTRPEAHAAVMAEVQQVLDWAELQFPGQRGPVEEGQAWDHAVLVQTEAGGWCTVTLTLAALPHVADALFAEFGGESS